MKVSVGSMNPVKIASVTAAFTKAFGEVDVVGVKVDSGISDMPTNPEQALVGATNRAQASLTESGADYGVGLEGYVIDTQRGMFLAGYAVVVHRDGRQGIGGAYMLQLPERAARQVRRGKEVGPVMDALIGQANTKQKQGAIGTLTRGLITRTQSFEGSVICALAPFISDELYKE
jgi:inosine/xanthosine triphosphatase